jgi:hypothetical protein
VSAAGGRETRGQDPDALFLAHLSLYFSDGMEAELVERYGRGYDLADRIDAIGHRLAALAPRAAEGADALLEQATQTIAKQLARIAALSDELDEVKSLLRRQAEEDDEDAAALAAQNAAIDARADLWECDRCDGYGWYEGGVTLQTSCERCGGTGVVDRSAARAAVAGAGEARGDA